MNWKWLSFLFVLLSSLTAFSQKSEIDTTVVNSDETQVLRTVRGDVFFGKAKSIASDSLFFQTQEQLNLSYSLEEIEWLGLVEHALWLKSQYKGDSRASKSYYGLGPQGHENLVYSSTAFPYPKGLKEFRNIDILYTNIDVGVSDNFSLGGGFILPFFLNFRTKYSFEASETIYLGAGFNSFLGLADDPSGFISHLFAIGTFGKPKQYFNITAGPALDWDFPEERIFFITIGGGFQFSEHWRVYSDIGLTPDAEGFVPTLLLSWFNPRHRFEFGILTVPAEFFVSIPILSYSYRF